MRRDLVEACIRNDRKAQEKLYMSYADAMYNVAFRMLGSEEDAQDILQMSFIDVFRNLHRFKYESTPGAWIKRIVVNKTITFIKQKKRNHFEALYDETKEYEDPVAVDQDIDVKVINRAIKSLPNGYREVLTLYLIEGYDHKEISDILGITTATSKSQYSRAKRKLRELLRALNYKN